MHFTSAEITAWIGAFLWPFFRVAAMLMSSAVFGMRALPIRLRLMLALAIALALAPLAVPSTDAIAGSAARATALRLLL